jgi:hypothetical protein
MTEEKTTENLNGKVEVPNDLNILPSDISSVLQENEYFKLLCINKAQARVIETLQNACEVLKSEVNKLTEEKGVKNAKGR